MPSDEYDVFTNEYPHGQPYNPNAAPVYHTSADAVRGAIRNYRQGFRVPVAMPYLHFDTQEVDDAE